MNSALILEDEAIAARRLHRMLDDLFPGEVQVEDTFSSVHDLAAYMTEHEQPDILFLDIMVADGNSFELFDIVDVRSKVIFITAYDEHAIRAFKENAIHYLLKPLKKHELQEAVQRAMAKEQEAVNEVAKELQPAKERFLIRFANKLHSIPIRDIAYIYSEEKLSFFIQSNGSRVPSDLPLQEIMTDLDPQLFFRANRQFIVQIQSVAKIIRHSRSRLKLELLPSVDQDIIVSTETTPKFKQWLER